MKDNSEEVNSNDEQTKLISLYLSDREINSDDDMNDEYEEEITMYK